MKINKQLLDRFEMDMRLRGMSDNTKSGYKRDVIKFLEYCGKPIDKLSEEDVRQYLIHRMYQGSCSSSTLNVYNAAIRFFFAITLNRTMNYLQMPRFKKQKSLPVILSRNEIQYLLTNCNNVKHKSFFMLAYGGGLRVSEIAALKVCDINSKSMRIFIRAGKGKKDRYTILSNECLCVLREYWSMYRPKHKEGWLFTGIKNVTKITPDAIEVAFKSWIKRLGIQKNVSIHSLRHAFATHLLEDGINIFQIKELLGHASLNSTTVYLHLANTTAGVVSPLDRGAANE